MLGMSLSPCCRFHPAEVNEPYRSDFGCSCCLRPPVEGSAFGATHFRGHICVHFRYGPVTRRLPEGDVVDRLQSFGFRHLCYPNYGALTFTPAGLSPAEHASLRWTHNRTGGFPAINSPIPPLHATVGKLRGSALNRYLNSEPKFSTKLPRNFTAAHDADDLPADLLLDHRPPRY